MTESDKAALRLEVKRRMRTALGELEEALWLMEDLPRDEAETMFDSVADELVTFGGFDFWALAKDLGPWDAT